MNGRALGPSTLYAHRAKRTARGKPGAQRGASLQLNHNGEPGRDGLPARAGLAVHEGSGTCEARRAVPDPTNAPGPAGAEGARGTLSEAPFSARRGGAGTKEHIMRRRGIRRSRGVPATCDESSRNGRIMWLLFRRGDVAGDVTGCFPMPLIGMQSGAAPARARVQRGNEVTESSGGGAHGSPQENDARSGPRLWFESQTKERFQKARSALFNIIRLTHFRSRPTRPCPCLFCCVSIVATQGAHRAKQTREAIKLLFYIYILTTLLIHQVINCNGGVHNSRSSQDGLPRSKRGRNGGWNTILD